MQIRTVSKTNDNPCVLIPWTPTPYNLQVFLRSLSPEARKQFRSHGYLVLPPDPNTHLAWKYQILEETLMRRHCLRIYPPTEAVAAQPRFLCEVCGKYRLAEHSRVVQCGWSATDAMDYLVCPTCIQKNALEISRELGFYVRVKA